METNEEENTDQSVLSFRKNKLIINCKSKLGFAINYYFFLIKFWAHWIVTPENNKINQYTLQYPAGYLTFDTMTLKLSKTNR